MKKIMLMSGLLGLLLLTCAGCGTDSLTGAASGDVCIATYNSSVCGQVSSCSTSSGQGYYKAANGTRFNCSGSNCSTAASNMINACP